MLVNIGIFWSLSAIKSAAGFDGAQIKIFSWSVFFIQLEAIAHDTNVLLVPGGPCIKHNLLLKALLTALTYEVEKVLGRPSTYISSGSKILSSVFGGIPVKSAVLINSFDLSDS